MGPLSIFNAHGSIFFPTGRRAGMKGEKGKVRIKIDEEKRKTVTTS